MYVSVRLYYCLSGRFIEQKYFLLDGCDAEYSLGSLLSWGKSITASCDDISFRIRPGGVTSCCANSPYTKLRVYIDEDEMAEEKHPDAPEVECFVLDAYVHLTATPAPTAA